MVALFNNASTACMQLHAFHVDLHFLQKNIYILRHNSLSSLATKYVKKNKQTKTKKQIDCVLIVTR